VLIAAADRTLSQKLAMRGYRDALRVLVMLQRWQHNIQCDETQSIREVRGAQRAVHNAAAEATRNKLAVMGVLI